MFLGFLVIVQIMNVSIWLSIVSTSIDPHATASLVYIGLYCILSAGLLVGFGLRYCIWPRSIVSSAPTATGGKKEAKDWSKYDDHTNRRCC